MNLRHIALTQEQWDETWNSLPSEKRFFAKEELRFKAGYVCFELDGMLLWIDYLLPKEQRSYEVEIALKKYSSEGREI